MYQEIEEYEYDQFAGKWIRKRKERRASNPKVMERREKKKGRPKFFTRVKNRAMFRKKSSEESAEPMEEREPRHLKEESTPVRETVPLRKGAASMKEEPTAANEPKTIIPLTKQEAQVHKNVHSTLQNELKTKLDALSVKEKEEKIKKESSEIDKNKEQASLVGTSKVGMYVVGGIGLLVAYKVFFGNSNNPAAVVSS